MRSLLSPIIPLAWHDVLTVQEAGRANQKIPDSDVLAFATSSKRAVITENRKDFFRLHRIQPDHAWYYRLYER